MSKQSCPYCRADIGDDALFCPQCGKAVAPGLAQEQSNPPEYGSAGTDPQAQQTAYPPYGSQSYPPYPTPPPYQSPCPPYTYPPSYAGRPPYGQPYPSVPPGYQPRNRIAAGVLALLVGFFGVHNFYLGYTGRAVAQLLLTVLSCGLLAIVSYIWSLVEGIQILTGSMVCDARGVPMVQ